MPLVPAEAGGLDDPRLTADLSNWRARLALLDEERLLPLGDPLDAVTRPRASADRDIAA